MHIRGTREQRGRRGSEYCIVVGRQAVTATTPWRCLLRTRKSRRRSHRRRRSCVGSTPAATPSRWMWWTGSRRPSTCCTITRSSTTWCRRSTTSASGRQRGPPPRRPGHGGPVASSTVGPRRLSSRSRPRCRRAWRWSRRLQTRATGPPGASGRTAVRSPRRSWPTRGSRKTTAYWSRSASRLP
jgi:hypothetical protein